MPEIEMFDMFSTPFLHGRLSEQAVAESLAGLEKLKERFPGNQPHPFHCDIWTTYECERNLFKDPNFATVTNEINVIATEYCRKRKAKVEARMTEFWANVQNLGQFQETHHHKGRMISGSLYLKVPQDETGAITFNTPRTHMYDDQYWDCDADKEYISIIPEIGDIYMFPSWMMHGTRPVKEQRISMAFNYVAVT